MADNLLRLASELKDKITSKKTTIDTANAQLVERVTQMNQVAEQILAKVGNLTVGSATLQQNIDTQARQITDLTRELEETRQLHQEKQRQIDELNTNLAEANGRGEQAGAIRTQLDQLQTETDASRQKITTLTQEIEQSSNIIQEMIGSIDAQQLEQGQTDLTNLTAELSQHIDAINAAIPGAVAPPVVQPPVVQPPVVQPPVVQPPVVPPPVVQPPAARPSKQPIQRDPTPQEMEIINKADPSLQEATERNRIMSDPTLAAWRKKNPQIKKGGKRTRKYKLFRKLRRSKKHKR